MKAKYPITFTIRKRLEELASELPQVPHFVINAQGQYELQKMSRTKHVTGQELLNNDSKTIVNGEYVSDLQNYLQKGYAVRMMNHKVNIMTEYGKYETVGAVEYCRRVNELSATIEKIKSEYKPPTRWNRFVEWVKSLFKPKKEIKLEIASPFN